MDLKFFKALEIVIKSYSRQHAQKLIDHNLSIKIMLKVSLPSFLQLSQKMQIHPGQSAAFVNKKGVRQIKELVGITINHPLGLQLGQLLMKAIDECIIIGSRGSVSNVLGSQQENDVSGSTRAILFKVGQVNFEETTQWLDSYLSLCEVFFGHLHLVVSCFECQQNTDLMEELKAKEDQDQFSNFRQNGYFRILEERASRITLEQLSQSCSIQRQRWGELMVFGDGIDGIVFWLTYNRLPILGVTPSIRIKGSKGNQLQTFWESNIGCKVLVRKQNLKSQLEDLETTIVIFNLREEYSKELENWIQPFFEAEAKKMLTRGALLRHEGALQDKMAMCERTAQLLGVPAIVILKKLIG